VSATAEVVFLLVVAVEVQLLSSTKQLCLHWSGSFAT